MQVFMILLGSLQAYTTFSIFFFCFQNEPITLANQHIPRAPQSRAVLTRKAVESNTTYNPPIVCPRNIHAKKPQ